MSVTPVSPDATPYVDLRLFDRDAQDVFDGAIAILKSYLPEWDPREGHTEVLLLEALALEVEEGIFTINRLPGAIVEILLRLYGIDRDLGTPPSATFTFTMVDDQGYTIPAGTRIALPLSDGDSTMVFTVPGAVVAAPGTTSVAAVGTGDTATSLVNGTIPGSPVELLDSIATVESADLTSYVAGGVDPETDVAWFTRGVQRFSRLAETLVLPRHFTAAALELVEVSRAFTVDNTIPGDPAGTDAGHVTVAVYGDGDVLSADAKEAIRADFDSRAQANLAVHVTDPTLTDVSVSATVVALPGYGVSQVQASCVAALTAYLSPATWPWAGTVYRNELISLLDRVEGVDRVVSVDTPDTVLSGIAPLARLGSAAITVNLP